MVNYIVPTLLVPALVGCVLFGTVASGEIPSLDRIGQYFQLFKPSAAEPPEQANEPLSSLLQRESLELVRLRGILKGYGNKEERISRYTIKELAEMCEPTLEKCSYDEFERVIRIGDEFKETIPKLYEYSQYCLRTELRSFCQDNAAKVVSILKKTVSKNDRILAQNLLSDLRGRTIISNVGIVASYIDLRDNDRSETDEFEFLSRFKNALFLHYIKVLGKNSNDPVARVVKFVKGSNHADEMFISPWDPLDRVVERFIRLGYSKIMERVYDRASTALRRKLNDRSLEPEQVETILLEYKHKDVEILGDTVAQQIEMCQVSVAKCNYDDFERIMGVHTDWLHGLYKYRTHCAVVKLKEHCRNHIDEVAPVLEKEVDQKDKDLVQRILELVQKDQSIDHAPAYKLDASFSQAYELVMKSEYKKEVFSPSEEEDFLARVKRALFLRYLKISAECQAKPESISLATERDTFSKFFESFVSVFKVSIEKSMSVKAKRALISQLEDENNSLTNENVREMLQEYEHKDVKICDKTVGELVEMCKPSMSNCFYKAFSEITKTTKYCEKDQPKILQYRKYCAEQIVTGYCRKNSEKLLRLVLGKISEGVKLYVFFLVKTEDDCMSRERERGRQIDQDTALRCQKRALDRVMQLRFKEVPNQIDFFRKEEFKPFRRTLCYILEHFTELNYLFSAGLKYKQGQEGAPRGDFWMLSDKAEQFWNYVGCSQFQ